MGSRAARATVYAAAGSGAEQAWHPLRARALGGGAFRLEEAPPGGADSALRAGDEVLCERCPREAGEPRWVVRRRIERGWSVWREDDHGRRFEASRSLSHEAAGALVGRLEAGGHKQRYWIVPTGDPQ